MSTGRTFKFNWLTMAISASLFPAAAMALSCPQFPDCVTVSDTAIAGDADADGSITYADAQTTEQAISAPYVLTCSQAAVLDINLNGAIDRQDVVALTEVANSGGSPTLLANFKRGWGDINQDGFIDIRDVSALMKLLESGGKPGQFNVAVDLNVDKVFDTKDVIELRQCVQGRIDRMGVIAK